VGYTAVQLQESVSLPAKPLVRKTARRTRRNNPPSRLLIRKTVRWGIPADGPSGGRRPPPLPPLPPRHRLLRAVVPPPSIGVSHVQRSASITHGTDVYVGNNSGESMRERLRRRLPEAAKARACRARPAVRRGRRRRAAARGRRRHLPRAGVQTLGLEESGHFTRHPVLDCARLAEPLPPTRGFHADVASHALIQDVVAWARLLEDADPMPKREHRPLLASTRCSTRGRPPRRGTHLQSPCELGSSPPTWGRDRLGFCRSRRRKSHDGAATASVGPELGSQHRHPA
jgi:hypothetical protein